MSVIPLKISGPRQTVARTLAEFEAAHGRNGSLLLIDHIDPTQLLENNNLDSDVSYDLRVGAEYRDHRDLAKRPLAVGETIPLLPGQATILETEEVLRVPKNMFGYVVPKVSILQEGVSNTLSKVDPGYQGPLLVTLFNLGKKNYEITRGKPFCSLVMHTVGDDAKLYNKDGKKIPIGRPRGQRWRKTRDFLQSNADFVSILALLATILSILWGAFHRP